MRCLTGPAGLRPVAAVMAAAGVLTVVMAAAAGVVVALPRQYRVEGLSMAPGLLPGDVVTTGRLAAFDRVRSPRRFDRWIVAAPDGTPAIKRIVGLPGETVSIADGDLAINGRNVLTPPAILAETASRVPQAAAASLANTADGPWLRVVPPTIVYDDAECAPTERRTLLPVRDVGLAAVIRLQEPPRPDVPIRVRFRVGTRVVPWRMTAAGRYAVIAGRLDDRLVGAAWPIADQPPVTAPPRTCLPPRPPAEWQVAAPWPKADDDDSPTLAIGITAGGEPLTGEHGRALIEQSVVWRDLLHRPAADGVVEWRLGPETFFALGDFPSASRDSRHWGPIGRPSLQARVCQP